MTHSSAHFIGKSTLAGVTNHPVVDDMWDASFSGEPHIALSERADVFAIVPATADLLARLAQGRADDVVAASLLCARGPIIAAPAMHPRMWAHPATQRNVHILVQDSRVHLVGPVHGAVANGDVGVGRMAEPEAICEAILRALKREPQNLAGRHVVVTAGPTFEDIDPVRFVGNRSSGKMGFAIAEHAQKRGARVTLIAGPVHLSTPAGVARVDVRSAIEMQNALQNALAGDASAVVMAAAVADFRPEGVSIEKLRKQAGESSRTIAMVANPDLLAQIGASRGEAKKPALIGFCLETSDLESRARHKLVSKNVDAIFANLAGDALGGDQAKGLWVTRQSCVPLQGAKSELAAALCDRLAAMLDAL
jgi:phosphopantothenoylcysteine decarboxylase/phosphopantothenate--cysteine ligase